MRTRLILWSLLALCCGERPPLVDGGVAAGGASAGSTAGGSTAGGSAGGVTSGGGTAGGSTAGGVSGGAAAGGSATGCSIGLFASCAAACDVRLIVPGSAQRYCSMQCSGSDECRPYGAQLGCSLITGGACTPRCSSHLECRDAGFGYCDLDGGTCDTFASCKSAPECVALGFRGCDVQLELCY